MGKCTKFVCVCLDGGESSDGERGDEVKKEFERDSAAKRYRNEKKQIKKIGRRAKNGEREIRCE